MNGRGPAGGIVGKGPGAGAPGGRVVDPVENILRPLVGKIRNHRDMVAVMAGGWQPGLAVPSAQFKPHRPGVHAEPP